jgi:membrane protease YdiL (CAAX protease family)
MKSTLLLILEFALILSGFILYALGYLPLPILPLILVAWVSLHIRHLRWWDVGLKHPDRWWRTIALALLVGVGYQVLDILLIAPLLQKLTGEAIDLSQFSLLRGNLVLLLAALALTWTVAAFLEEMFFRGYLLNRIIGLFGSERVGVIIALIGNAIVFGLGHAYQGTAGVVDTILAGLVLGGLYLLTGRNLWLPILTHGIIDTVGFIIIYTGLAG